MKYYIFLFFLVVSACSTTKQAVKNPAGTAIADGKLFASVFQQQAAEYKALCFQSYNFARIQLDQLLTINSSKPKAIITDIDETVLDNSAYDVQQVLQGKDYEPASWNAWTSRGEADTVPGAPSFLNYAASKGVTIFYVTNRNEDERPGTLKNLQKFNLPNSDNEHLVMKRDVSSKESRRQAIMKNFEVVLLIGDNLADFSTLFDKKSVEERNLNSRQIANQFGTRYVIIPNTVYGDWESALYKYDSRLTMAQKDSILRKAVRSW